MSVLTTERTTQVPTQPHRVDYVAPRANLHQDGEGYTLELEMPGVNKDGVEVTVEDGKLTLVGRRADVSTPGKLVYRERLQSEYRRAFDLDPSIDPAKVTASIDQGLLSVRLLKAETAKPRKITVS